MRKNKLVDGQIYHIFTRSIAGYEIFNNQDEYTRMIDVIRFYQTTKPATKFSRYKKLSQNIKENLDGNGSLKDNLIEIIAYCLMPTHLHLILKQIKKNGISIFMNKVLNSYTRYFNIKHGRKGPLWESRFKKVLVETDKQLLHLTRYIHLNPTTAKLIDDPIKWSVSSYKEYLSNNDTGICKYNDLLEIKPDSYKAFVEDRIGYQRELAKIKSLLLEY